MNKRNYGYEVVSSVNKPELRPCRYCGRTPVLESRVVHLEDGYGYAVVQCVGCGATGPHEFTDDTSRAVERWNNPTGVM